MKESGILTEQEFEEQKAKILAAPSVPVAPIQPVAAAGMMQPGMSMWSGMAPPKENAPNWWQMYKPDEGRGLLGQDGKYMRGQGPNDCGNCLFGFCCVPCAAGEVADWAADDKSAVLGPITCLGAFFLPFCLPCILSDGRKFSEHKIHGYHRARGGARISLTFPPPFLAQLARKIAPLSSLFNIATMPPLTPMRPLTQTIRRRRCPPTTKRTKWSAAVSSSSP